MQIDALFQAVEERQTRTGYWASRTGANVIPLTVDQARPVARKRVCKCGEETGTACPRCTDCQREYMRAFRAKGRTA